MAAHLARDVAEDLVVVVQLDAEHRVGQRLGDLALHLDLLFLRHATGQGSGWRLARSVSALECRLARPLLEEARHRVLQVLRGEQIREDARRHLVGLVHAARSEAADDPLRGPVGDGRPIGQLVRELHPLFEQLVVRDHPVDHVPALERRGVVEAAAHHELGGSRRPRSLRHPLRAPGARRQPDDCLDQAEARRLRRPDHVAAERDLETGGQTEAVDQGKGRDRQLLDPPHDRDQRAERVGGAALLLHPLEAVDVDPAGEDVALRAPDQGAGVGPLDLLHAGLERPPGVVAEQIERRVGEHDRRRHCRRARA